MFQIFPEKSVHRQQHTVRGWSVWVAIVTGTWIIAFIIGESSEWFFVRRRNWFQWLADCSRSRCGVVVPFFSDLLSLSESATCSRRLPPSDDDPTHSLLAL
jgi:hypothetical protein